MEGICWIHHSPGSGTPTMAFVVYPQSVEAEVVSVGEDLEEVRMGEAGET